MWPMIAEPDLRCAECRHTIQPGRLCLSELPEETPPGVTRRDFKNYCIGCPECWREGKHACYVRHLDVGGSTGKTPRSVPCARCGRRIGAGEKSGVDIYYEWPAEIDESASRRPSSAILSNAATAAGADTLIRGVPNGDFANIGEALQQKMVRAGLGGDRGLRSISEAQGFYQDTIPYPVRNLGPDVVRDYLDGKDASHIQSVQNTPHLAQDNSNLLWWKSESNRALGADNMSGWDQFSAYATNAFHASELVLRRAMDSAGTAALYAALLESPVAAIESYYHWQRGRKTGEEAIKDAAFAIGKRAAAGAVAGFAVSIAIISISGAATVLAAIAPVLIPVGLAPLYGYSALKRIQNARAYDLPPQLNQVGTYFCSPRCHTKFAYETGWSALIRWEENRLTQNTNTS